MNEEPIHRAKGALLQDFRTAHSPIQVKAAPGGISLEGTVDDLAERRAALRIVRQALGNLPVEDHLAIRQVPARSDEEIARHLWDAYEQDPTIDNRVIRIRVHDGQVRLEGEVDSVITRKLAGVIAWWIPGVREVDNQLAVSNTEGEGDVWILETIDVVLDKDFLLDRGDIMFSCKDGVVRLTGSVPSPEVKRVAENDMWAIEGVSEVVNDLVIIPRQSTTEFR